jgi:hypothetical protein
LKTISKIRVKLYQTLNNTISTTSELNNKISVLHTNQSGLNNILIDTNIKTLQQSYNYMLWSILALGTLLIVIKMKKT